MCRALDNFIFPLSQSGASDYRAVILALHDVIIALLLAMEGRRREEGGRDQITITAIFILQGGQPTALHTVAIFTHHLCCSMKPKYPLFSTRSLAGGDDNEYMNTAVTPSPDC